MSGLRAALVMVGRLLPAAPLGSTPLMDAPLDLRDDAHDRTEAPAGRGGDGRVHSPAQAGGRSDGAHDAAPVEAASGGQDRGRHAHRSEEHTSGLQTLMRNLYVVY